MMIFVNHDDLRSLELSEALLQKGYYVSNKWEDMKYAKVIYLGMKGFDFQHKLIFNKEEKILQENDFAQLMKKCVIMTLVYNHYLFELCQKYDYHYLCLIRQKEFLRKNSILTAEGVIAYLVRHRRMPIYQSRILVMGFGHCAKPIVRYLNAMGGIVDVALRNRELDSDVINEKSQPIALDKLKLNEYDIIVNTIPARVITNQMLEVIRKPVMILDIASFPYGLDHRYALRKGLNCQILSSVPCKYAYSYAGYMILEEIEKVIKK